MEREDPGNEVVLVTALQMTSLARRPLLKLMGTPQMLLHEGWCNVVCVVFRRCRRRCDHPNQLAWEYTLHVCKAPLWRGHRASTFKGALLLTTRNSGVFTGGAESLSLPSRGCYV